ncbi:MAG: alanine racemase, partial [Pseudomonadota bacterium]
MSRVSTSLLSAEERVARPQPAPQDAVLGGALHHATTNGRITIDPEAIVRNWHRLKRLAARDCGAVVKADAYGCGLDVVAPALARSGCDTFFVATAREGLRLRALVPDVAIYVLNGIFEDIRVAVEARLIPFISSRDALEDWPQTAPFALNVDTGMNRLGLTVEEAIAMAVMVKPTLVASHFGCADTPEHPLNTSQEERFTTVREAYRGARASFANSAALLTRPRAHYDLARPGIALYGGVSATTVAPLEPAVRLEARVIQVRDA